MRKNELPGYRKKVLSWCFYDWANSAFATTIIAAILPVYYSTVIAIDIPSYKATAFWSYTVSIALLITALTAPLIGAIADHINNKKLFLKIFTALGILFTALLCLIKTGDLLFASTIFIVANVGFALSEIFYNSLLKVVAAPEDIDRISTLGYTLGYLGGGILLAINVIFFILLPNEITAFKLSFLSVSLWWGIFSVPIFTNLGKPVQNTKKKDIIYLLVLEELNILSGKSETTNSSLYF